MRVALVLITALLALGNWISGVSAATVQLLGKDYESFTSTTCGGVGSFAFCSAYFPTNPTGKVIKITRVACNIRGNGTVAIVRFRVNNAQNDSVIKETYLDVANSVAYSGTDNIYSTVNAETSFLMGAGRVPVVVVQINGIVRTIDCSLSGVTVP